jgi:formylglycine-generating enzyme required for sulfatase activity
MNTRSHLSRPSWAVVIVLALSGLPDAIALAKDAAPRGIAAEPPAKGPAIKVDGGYMVPYTQTIPGTDITFEMIPVPGGEFLLGSPPGEQAREEDEGPQVRVKIEPFWIGKHEVTWGEYQVFMKMYDAFKKLQLLSSTRGSKLDEAEAQQPNWQLVKKHAWKGDIEAEWDVDAVTSPTPLYDATFTYGVGDQPNQPAVTITQFAAKQYTKWLSGVTGRDYRLPSEAEWEYAARAGTTTAYSFGDDPAKLEEYAWFETNGDYATHPVGSKQPNPWGLYDMHGNVAEWTLDEYVPDAYRKLGSGPVDAAAAIRWPTKQYPRSIRGGSWLEPAAKARSAARHKSDDEEWKLSDPNIPLSPWWYTEEPATAVGMRIIRQLEPLSAEDKQRVWEADVDDIRQDVQDRLREGRGALGVADESLPDAVKAAEELSKDS